MAVCEFMVACMMTFLLPGDLRAEEERASKIKAALVYYVMKFIEWPESSSGLTLCVAGSDSVTKELGELLRTKSIKSSSVKVHEIHAESDSRLSGCNVIYFSTDFPLAAKKGIRGALSPKQSTVTMCEGSRGYSPDCMVQIFEDSNKARLVIDPSQAPQRNLSISSELLDLAVIPTPPTG